MSNCRNVQDNGILQVGVGAPPCPPGRATRRDILWRAGKHAGATPLHSRVHREHRNIERDDDVAGKERDKDEHCRLEFGNGVLG